MFVIVLVVLVLLFSNSWQQCVPGNCPPSYDNLTTLKSGAPYSFKVGYLADCTQVSYISSARWVFYITNMNSTVLPDVDMQLYYHLVSDESSLVIATNELVETQGVQSLIIELPEYLTATAAQMATAYGVSVISVDSMTELFDDKKPFSDLFARLATPASHETYAMLQTLLHLGIQEVLYVYTDDVYGSQNYQLFTRLANEQGVSVNPLAIQTNVTQLTDVVDSRALIFDTDPSEGLPFLSLLAEKGIYGKTYFYMFSLDMARALTPVACMYPMLDGSLTLVPRRITVTPYYEYYSNGWNASDENEFPGSRVVQNNYWTTTIDAATIIISALDNLIKEGNTPDTVNGTQLHQWILNSPHPSFSGEFFFNENADRDVNFVLYNIHLAGYVNGNATYNTSIVALYNISNQNLTFYPIPIVYYNSSRILPVLMPRFSDLCSFQICHFRGNCSIEARCVCYPGFDGLYCENIADMTMGTRTIAAWAVPVSLVVVAAIVGMYLLQRRRKAIILRGITEKQRSEIPRSDIKLLERIGRGASGQVSKAMFRGTEVAVKRLVSSTSSKDAVDEFMLEAAIMCGLRHPNIVLFMGSSFDPILKEMMLVMEYMARGSVHDVIHNPKISMPYELQLHLALQAAQGMNFLHSSKPPVIHRDLKSHNILLDDKWNARISDFGITRIQKINKADGSSVKKGKIVPQCLGTIFWTAPEVLNGNSHTESSDCYSFGIVLWEIFHRAEPYMGIDAMVIAAEVPSKARRPEISDICPNEIKELMRACWHQDPGKRPSFQEIVNCLRTISAHHPLHNIDSQTSTSRADAPSGLVYVVNTDISSIFDLWEAAPRATMQALKLHNQIVRTTLETYGGYEISFSGSSFLAVFPTLVSALDWSVNLHSNLLHAPWQKQILAVPAAEQIMTKTGQLIWSGPRVRVSVHAGVIQPEKDHLNGRSTYTGVIVDRVKVILSATQIGDIVVSGTVHDEIIEKKIYLDSVTIERMAGTDNMMYYMLIHSSLANRRPPGSYGLSLNMDALPNSLTTDETKSDMRVKEPKWLVKWQDLSVKEPLGTGTVGDFSRAILDGKEVAVKCLINQKLREDDILELTSNAVILSRVNHPNLLPFYGVCLEDQSVAIITDYVSRGNLRELLSEEGIPISLSRRLKMAKEIAAGMTYLSMYPDLGVRIHDNFKSHNIMVTRDWTIKISDFGQSSIKDLCRTMTSVSNVAWTAPEVLEGEPLNNNSALYTFGIIMWELITRKIPYQTEHPIKVVNKILGGHRPPVPKEGIPQQYKDLMESCWHPYGNMRPSWHVIQSELSFILDGLPQ